MEEQLFRKTSKDLMLSYISKLDATKTMAEVHEGICGSHQLGEKDKMTDS